MGHKTMMRTIERLMQTRSLLAAMISLQVLWIVTMWMTGGIPNWRKLPILLVYSIVVGLMIGHVPAGFVSRIRQLREHLIQNERVLILILCGIVLIAGVAYANYQRPYIDEGYNFDASRIVAERGVHQFFASYASLPWLGENHPPLVPLVYGFAMRILGVNLLVVRLASLVLAIATVLLTYLMGSELYNPDTGLLAAFLLLSFPLFLRMSAAALTDIPVTFFFSLVLFLTLHLLRTPSYWLAGVAGLSIGAGLLSKYTMVLIYPVLLSYVALSRSFRQLKYHLGVVMFVSIGVLGIWLAYAYRGGILAAQQGTITSHASVVTATRWGKRWMLEMVSTRLTSALGFYNIPLLFLAGWNLLRRRDQSDLFVILWVAIVFLVLILTLPDARYFMLAFPALAIGIARELRRIPEATERAVLLALLYCGGALYLFVDLYRAPHLFLR
jgi:4-amino-4-deoxy-L-arabinose transferase-like glycosyltransferase